MSPKRVLLLAFAIGGALMILGWSQTWFEVLLNDGRRLAVGGSAAAGVLATGLAALAVAAALTIAPPVLRYVLGALGLVVGGIGAAVAASTLTDALAASLATITTETGIAGRESITAIVDSISVAPWPWVATAGAIIAVIAGAGVLLTARRWPTAASRYDRAPARRDDWEALTEGDDPTR